MPGWDEVEARLELECPTGIDRRPTEADLDRYEAAAGFKLPLDYRRLALAYGPGSVIGTREFEINAPGSPEAGLLQDLAQFNPPGEVSLPMQGLADEWITRVLGLEPGKARRMVFFCTVRDDENSFAWDPGEVTDPIAHEMAIYRFGSRSVNGSWRVASSFVEFLVEYVLRGQYGRDFDQGYDSESVEDHDTWGKGRLIPYNQITWPRTPPPAAKKPKRKRKTKKGPSNLS